MNGPKTDSSERRARQLKDFEGAGSLKLSERPTVPLSRGRGCSVPSGEELGCLDVAVIQITSEDLWRKMKGAKCAERCDNGRNKRCVTLQPESRHIDPFWQIFLLLMYYFLDVNLISD